MHVCPFFEFGHSVNCPERVFSSLFQDQECFDFLSFLPYTLSRVITTNILESCNGVTSCEVNAFFTYLLTQCLLREMVISIKAR